MMIPGKFRTLLSKIGIKLANPHVEFPKQSTIFGIDKNKFVRNGAIGLGALAMTSLFTLCYIAAKESNEAEKRILDQYEKETLKRYSEQSNNQEVCTEESSLVNSTYIVQQKDNLHDIAKSYKPNGMSTDEFLDKIIALGVSNNDFDTTGYSEHGRIIIRPGQKIQLPKIDPLVCDDAKKDVVKSRKSCVIKEGETLWDIAKKEVSSPDKIGDYINQIVKLNNLDTSDYARTGKILVKENQEIYLPEEEGNNLCYES